ncbi:MAG: BolA family transcriptional regulator [Proteobacteria bacterium]|nr:BolA family transcriptional regulator [Pseudomonadota bacterium]MCH7806266.1 BolA family transcriptional regulator [Pseudomonadota bacterium]MCH8082162.1 BolA family transcriptional regulator [Pseudomonadota bacterium]MCH8322283.1 BolA family transcriptional regulator [Pseudomonadota bacterium]
MAMQAQEIEKLITGALPGAKVTITDLAGDGDHYSAHVVFEGFKGLSRVKQHQIVYQALEGRMGGQLHALALRTSDTESET